MAEQEQETKGTIYYFASPHGVNPAPVGRDEFKQIHTSITSRELDELIEFIDNSLERNNGDDSITAKELLHEVRRKLDFRLNRPSDARLARLVRTFVSFVIKKTARIDLSSLLFYQEKIVSEELRKKSSTRYMHQAARRGKKRTAASLTFAEVQLAVRAMEESIVNLSKRVALLEKEREA